MSKRKKSYQQRKAPPPSRRRWLPWAILGVILLIFIAIFFTILRTDKRTAYPQFQKDGELVFVSQTADETLAQIDIEIADDDLERSRGLMWRRSMEEMQGMLFVMDEPEPQSFWMLNTYLSLDIIFADADQTIVKISPQTKPQALDPITSEAPALYVIEVLAGFCERHGIREGDRFSFSRLQ